MFRAFNFHNAGKSRAFGSNEELERLLQGQATMAEVLSFQGLTAELPFAASAHCYFSNDRVCHLIDLVFKRSELQHRSFDEARKLAFVASELLSTKVPALVDFFVAKESVAADKQGLPPDQHSGCPTGETEKDLLLSPTNSDRSRGTAPKETFRKQAFQQLLDSALSRDDIDETRAGYLAKVLQFYFRRDRNEFLEAFFDDSLRCQRFLDFLDFHSLTDFLGQLCTAADSSGSDSMILQDAGPPADPRFNSLRADFLLRLLTTRAVTSSFETASNVRLLLDAFVAKRSSQADGLATLGRLFEDCGFVGHLGSALLEADKPSTLYEVLLMAKAVSVLLGCPEGPRGGEPNGQSGQWLPFGPDTRHQLHRLLAVLKGLTGVGRLENFFASRFGRREGRCLSRFRVAVLDTLGNLLGQKSVDASEAFEDRQFLGDFMVC